MEESNAERRGRGGRGGESAEGEEGGYDAVGGEGGWRSTESLDMGKGGDGVVRSGMT